MTRIKDMRPRRLADVVGRKNQVTLSTLRPFLRDRRGFAGLLLGGIGSGKTSTARILKAGYNCLRPDPATGEACWACPHCLRCDAGHNGEWLTYQTWEIDGTRRPDREFLAGLVEEARAGFLPPFLFADELARLDEHTAQPVLFKFVEDLADGVFVGAAMADDRHEFRRHKIHPALHDRLTKFHLTPPEPDEVVTFFSLRVPEWGVNADEDTLRLLVDRSGASFRECLRVLDHAQLANSGRLDRAFLDSMLPVPRLPVAPGTDPFADDAA